MLVFPVLALGGLRLDQGIGKVLNLFALLLLYREDVADLFDAHSNFDVFRRVYVELTQLVEVPLLELLQVANFTDLLALNLHEVLVVEDEPLVSRLLDLWELIDGRRQELVDAALLTPLELVQLLYGLALVVQDFAAAPLQRRLGPTLELRH